MISYWSRSTGSWSQVTGQLLVKTTWPVFGAWTFDTEPLFYVICQHYYFHYATVMATGFPREIWVIMSHIFICVSHRVSLIQSTIRSTIPRRDLSLLSQIPFNMRMSWPRSTSGRPLFRRAVESHNLFHVSTLGRVLKMLVHTSLFIFSRDTLCRGQK